MDRDHRLRGFVSQRIRHAAASSPARLAILLFSVANVVVALLLTLPFAHAHHHHLKFVDALFTGVSAICVTGLTTVDTSTAWSPFGLVIIALAIKMGGLGVLTLASLLSLTVSRQMGLAQRVITASETRAEKLSEVGAVIRVLIITSTLGEACTALALIPGLRAHGFDWPTTIWQSAFYGVSAFNNAGFVPTHGGFGQFIDAPWITVPIALSVFIGSLGFPVVLVLIKHFRHPNKWTLHTKLTLATTLILLGAGMVGIGALEWTNPHTLGALPLAQKINASFFAAVMPRSGGFDLVNVAHMHQSTWLFTDMLMFVGGGSGSTAGGIKVTTLALLFLSILAEARGDKDVEAFGRRIPPATVRQAVAVLFIGGTLVTVATLALLALTDKPLADILFETLSAFATVGLSTGITPSLPTAAKYVLIGLMVAGRVGTVTLSAALALRDRRRVIRLPEDRPMVG